jgi:hypothetical protein|tara:strand:- start:2386 stop:2595 length:210 start_codon:yes stop_codon:yes gene_type:complete
MLFEEVIEKIIARVDPEELVDLLDLSTEMIVNKFPDRVKEKLSNFYPYFGDDELGSETDVVREEEIEDE